MGHFTLFVAVATLYFIGYEHAAAGAVTMPPGCEGLDYCTQQPDVHKALVSEMDKTMAISKYWSGLNSGKDFDEMADNYQTDTENCGYITATETPFIIKANTTNENKLVVQTGQFRQRIETTKCLNKRDSCLDQLKAEKDGINTRCAERYTTITLYVYENNKIVPESVKIPVCCTCIIEYDR